MCGFAGFIMASELAPGSERTIRAMTDTLLHRGPDVWGRWLDREAGVALGHRRLSILDLSPAGKQPMTSPSGRYVIVYNGEIYNHCDIRSELEGVLAYRWKGHSDTEVLMAAVDRWGIAATLRRLNGMFAFALWDRRDRCLYLARDRMGEKPLYYGCSNGIFLFASELKALTVHPDWRGDVDKAALALFLRHHYVPGPGSIWQGIKKLPPAHYVRVEDGGRRVGEPQPFWDFQQIAEAGADNPLSDSPARVDEFEDLLKDAVKRRMEADVPLGVFLSGGLDSSVVAALMQAQSAEPVRTFSIGFREGAFDEAPRAKAVAAHLGTRHTELYVTADQALAVVPDLPVMWDEPFADVSQIPTHLVSRMARQHVTVGLSGDGGDELFGGYSRYVLATSLWRRMQSLPLSARRFFAWVLRRPPVLASLGLVSRTTPGPLRPLALADRLLKVADLSDSLTAEELYARLTSHWDLPTQVLTGSPHPEAMSVGQARLPDFQRYMMYLDALTYLPDNILTKVDRASMAVSLEARVPFLDHRVVEYAWRLPNAMKIRDGQGKWILRQLLARYVPPELTERPKMGFGVPLEEWLRGPLRPWAEDLLGERRLREEGYFDHVAVRRIWSEHVTGKRRWQSPLWVILMFQAWLQGRSENAAMPGKPVEPQPLARALP